MALIVADRVRETSTTTGTGSLTLAGAVTGFRTFNTAIGTGNTCYYTITNRDVQSEWEVGYGTLSASTTLARTAIIASSNSNNAVSFSAGTKDVFVVKPAETDMLIDPTICQGRLTLESGVPVSVSNLGNTTIYWSPYNGNRVSLFDGNKWKIYSTVEISFSSATVQVVENIECTTTSGSKTVTTATTAGLYPGWPVSSAHTGQSIITEIVNSTTFTIKDNALSSFTDYVACYRPDYDVYIYNNAGVIALTAVAWTGQTTPTTRYLQDGIWVLSSDKTKRLVGSYRITNHTSVVQDRVTIRNLWNMYNRVIRKLAVIEATASWNYTTAAFHHANGNTANQVEVMVGLAGDMVSLQANARSANASANVQRITAIGVDGTANDSETTLRTLASAISNSVATLNHYPSAGFHYYTWLEFSGATGTTTWTGDNTCGLTGFCQA